MKRIIISLTLCLAGLAAVINTNGTKIELETKIEHIKNETQNHDYSISNSSSSYEWVDFQPMPPGLLMRS